MLVVNEGSGARWSVEHFGFAGFVSRQEGKTVGNIFGWELCIFSTHFSDEIKLPSSFPFVMCVGFF